MYVQGAILCCRQEVGVIKGGDHCCDAASLAVMRLALPVWSTQHACNVAAHCNSDCATLSLTSLAATLAQTCPV